MTTTKDRSYTVRRQIADLLGKPHSQDFTCNLTVVLDGRQVQLEGTSNAGFRGIEGRFFHVDTGEWFTESLGLITKIDGTVD